MKIEDFGHKIGGARKDLWRVRGLCIDDLPLLNEAEKHHYINKEHVWPAVKTKKLVESGQSKFIVFWKKEIRKDIQPIPITRLSHEESVKSYVSIVSEIRDMVMAVKTEEDIQEFYNYVKSHTVIENRITKLCSEWRCVVSRRIINKRDYHEWMKYKIETTNFPYGNSSQEEKKERKKAFVPPQLNHIQREGIDYRRGRDVTTGYWQKEFSFRGVEFGNWMSQKDRQVSMNYAYDAIKDLAYALNISLDSITFHGELSLAFGARGISRAAAHYEPLRKVINLTKMSGAGCVAHEWMHALDHYIAIQCGINNGTLASENVSNGSLPPSLVELIKALKTDSEGNETDYMKGSRAMNIKYAREPHGYWTSNCEMLARAFACYVKDCLGIKSDYLIAHADCYELDFENQHICAIPQGEERELFNELFDQLFYDLKKLGYVEKAPKKAKKSKAKKKTVIYNFDDYYQVAKNGQITMIL